MGVLVDRATGFKVLVIQHEMPFILSKLRIRQNMAVKWRSSEDSHPFSKWVLSNEFQLLNILIYIGPY